MILIDGVRYQLMKPANEEMLEDMVREHSKDIWGENSVYFDKKRLKAVSGITSIPDGYVVVFETMPRWYVVEVELSTHQLHNHLTPQISKFSSGINNKANRDEIIDRIYSAIENDDELMGKIRGKVAPSEVYKFLTGVIKGTPSLAIIIDEKTMELNEVLENLPVNFKEVLAIDFKTYLREGCDSKVHAHFFEPLYATRIVNPPPSVRSSFSAEPTVTGTKDPWDVDGEAWHKKQCGPKYKEILGKLDHIIRSNFQVDGPNWNQKYYIAYRIGGHNWLTINTHPSTLILRIYVKSGSFQTENLAKQLGIVQFSQAESLSEKLGLPSSVTIIRRNQKTDRVNIRIKEDFNLESPAFLKFLQECRKTFSKS